MRLNFQSCESSFSPGACNMVAHKLAAMGASSKPDSFSLLAEAAPVDVSLLVISNVAVSNE